MTSKPLMNLVATQCRPQVEEKFNKWYNDIHIPMLFKFKGMKEVTRYKPLQTPGDKGPIYVAVYLFESPSAFEAYGKSPELAEALAEMKESWPDGGFEIVSRVQYEPIKTWKK